MAEFILGYINEGESSLEIDAYFNGIKNFVSINKLENHRKINLSSIENILKEKETLDIGAIQYQLFLSDCLKLLKQNKKEEIAIKKYSVKRKDSDEDMNQIKIFEGLMIQDAMNNAPKYLKAKVVIRETPDHSNYGKIPSKK